MSKKINTKPRRRGQLSDADCAKIRRLLDQVITGRISPTEGDRRAEVIREKARQRVVPKKARR
jgi:hypothetical protein